MNTAYHGIVPPMITPLRARDEIDVPGLERLIEHIIGGGVHGLFVLGTTGEAPSLSYRLRRELIERTCKQVAGRVPVLVGVTDTAFVEALNISKVAADSGAKALVLAAPYYFPNSQPELLEYMQHFAPELPLPMFLYNMPTHTKTFFEIDTVRRAMDIPNIIGMKDSSGNMLYYHQLVQLLAQKPEWSLLMGPEELLGESVLLGGHGGVCGGANLCPRLYVDLYNAARSKDVMKITDLHARVMRISSSLYKVGKHSSAFIKGLKCSLNLLGVCDDFVAEPFHRFREPERNEVKKRLEQLGISQDGFYPKNA